MGHEVVVARRVGEGAVAVAVVRVMKPLTMMMTRGGGHGGLVGQRGIHFVLLKEGENGIIIDWPINQTNRGQRKWWRDGGRAITNALWEGASWDVAMERPKSRPRPPTLLEDHLSVSRFFKGRYLGRLGCSAQKRVKVWDLRLRR